MAKQTQRVIVLDVAAVPPSPLRTRPGHDTSR